MAYLDTEWDPSWDNHRPVPVTVLTGFQGVGKTTLLEHILRSLDHGKRFAIVENEFGEVGVDEAVISESVDEEVVEVMNGCICCTVRCDLVTSLKKLYGKVAKFDAVIIETTGLADPSPVAQTFFVDEDIRWMYTLDGIITVVDAKHITRHLEQKAEGVENEPVEQLAFADRILLNKTDLISDPLELDVVEARVRAINSQAPIYRCQQGRVDPSNLINVGAFDLDRVLKLDPEFLSSSSEQRHDERASSVSCKFEGELHVMKLREWINDLMQCKAEDLFRYKGVFAVKGMDEKYVFQGVHMLYTGFFHECARWKEGEVRECRCIFTGRNLDKEALRQSVMDCKVESELRFKVGDEVEVFVKDSFQRGTILEVWDEGHPYLIELRSGMRGHAAEDTDDYVRHLPGGRDCWKEP